MAHRRGETLGQEGRYRRTPSSPVTSSKGGAAASTLPPGPRPTPADFHASVLKAAAEVEALQSPNGQADEDQSQVFPVGASGNF